MRRRGPAAGNVIGGEALRSSGAAAVNELLGERGTSRRAMAQLKSHCASVVRLAT